MICPRRFLFFVPVETQRRRRAIVIGYYGAFTTLTILFLWFCGPGKHSLLFPLAFYSAAFLGGLGFTGPVERSPQTVFKVIP